VVAAGLGVAGGGGEEEADLREGGVWGGRVRVRRGVAFGHSRCR
jgi:hypothetical protein